MRIGRHSSEDKATYLFRSRHEFDEGFRQPLNCPATVGARIKFNLDFATPPGELTIDISFFAMNAIISLLTL